MGLLSFFKGDKKKDEEIRDIHYSSSDDDEEDQPLRVIGEETIGGGEQKREDETLKKTVKQNLPEQNLLEMELREPTSEDLIRSNEENTKKGEGFDISTEKLEEKRKEALEKRLPELEKQEGDEQTYFKREKSMKPPLQLEEMEIPFPPPKQIDIPEKVKEQLKEETEGPLRVIRYTPEGEQRIVPHYSITFSQPMIEVSSVGEQAKRIAEQLPITIEPKVEGKYRWKGTKTLVFEPKHRFPGSTQYKVTLKAGVNSALANIEGLVSTKPTSEETTFTFSTEPMKMTTSFPDYREYIYMRKDPIFFMQFNQKIDQEYIVSKLQGSMFLKAKLMTKEDVAKRIDNAKREEKQYVGKWKSCLHQAIEGQHVFFTFDTDKELDASSPYNVSLPKGVKSAEGPIVTRESFDIRFKTYGDMKLEKRPSKAKYTPYQELTLKFTNQLDLDAIEDPYDEEIIKIEPKIEGLVITGSGMTIRLKGKTLGKTRYTISVSEKIVDVYGQSCIPSSIRFPISAAEQSIQAHKSGHYIVDPTRNNENGKNGKDTDFFFRFATVNVTKVKVDIFQMKPEDYRTTRFGNLYTYLNKPANDYTPAEYLGTNEKPVYSSEMIIPENADNVVESEIDLRSFLAYPSEGLGHLGVHIKPLSWEKTGIPRLAAYIECTRLGAQAYSATEGGLSYFVSNLMDGSPIEEAIVYKGSTKMGVTDNHGMLMKDNYIHDVGDLHRFVYGNDVTLIRNLSTSNFNGEGPRINMFNDRGLFKPNEDVFIKGVARYIVAKNKHLEPDYEAVQEYKKLSWTLHDPRNVKLGEGELTLNEYGSFSWSFTLPDNMNLGDCRFNVTWKVIGRVHIESHVFKVQEFRTPEYRVNASVKSKRYIASSSAVVRTKASYYSGGGLSNATVTYKVKQQQSSYAPPNWGGFAFQSSFPSWLGSLSNYTIPFYSSSGEFLTYKDKTDSDGSSIMAVGFTENSRNQKTPVTISATVDVQDINRQVISSSASFLVHPSSQYVGLKAVSQCLNPGDEFSYDLVVAGIDGVAIPKVPVQLRLTRTIYVRKGFRLMPETTIVFEKSEESLDEAKELNFKVKDYGTYVLEATVVDEQERENASRVCFYVTGGEKPAGANIRSQKLVVVPNKNVYNLGDEAKVLVQAPFTGVSHGFYATVIHGKIEEKSFKTNKEGYALLTIPITDHYWNLAKLRVFLSGTQERAAVNGRVDTNKDLPRQPAFGEAEVELKIALDDAKLVVQCIPEKNNINPGENLPVKVKVVDMLTEKPVANCEVCLLGVDEAVLSLTGYQIHDLIHHFHPTPGVFTRSASNFTNVYVVAPPSLKFEEKVAPIPPPSVELFNLAGPPRIYRSAPRMRMECKSAAPIAFCAVPAPPSAPAPDIMDFGATMDSSDEEDVDDGLELEDEEDNSMIAVRSNFKPNCAFMPHLVTDENGEVEVTFEMPDNLTEFRITAVANSKSRDFGMHETQVRTQLPVAIRPSMPRFLNFGDEAELTVVLTNQSSKDITLDLVARFTNLELLDATKGAISVKIPLNGRAEIRFPVRTVKCGTARFQIGASVRGTKFSDAVEDKFPIFTPSTFETVATYGEMDGNTTIAQPIRPPTKVYNEFGDVKVELMSTAVNSLTDSFLYIYHYKHACAEQTASRILSIVTLEDILLAFKLEQVPSESAIVSNVAEGLKKLNKLQWKGRDWQYGAYVWWSWKEKYPSLYTTIHAGQAMARAMLSKRHSVDGKCVDANITFLKSLKSVFKRYPFNLYTEYCKNSIRLSALYVLAIYALSKKELKPFVLKEANEIINNFGGLKLKHGDSVWSMDSLGWLAFALHIANPTDTRITDICKFLLTHVNEEAGTAHFITSYEDNPEAELVLLRSNRRTDAILIEMLCYARPKTEIIPKLVKGLLAHRKKGRWGSTQENVYCLIACQKYFQTFEKLTPDFIARMWLGGNYMGEATFKGRTIEQQIVKVPMNILVPDAKKEEYAVQPLILNKEGQGRLYYRLSINYAPRDLNLKPLNHGFEVIRRYEEVKKGTLRIDDQGVIHVKSGELYRVRLTMTNVARRYHVALVDYLPAGFEPLNPELGSNRLQIPSDVQSASLPRWFNRYRGGLWSFYYYRPYWYIHENMRDERVEAFTDLLWEGTHEYTFVCRATTIGNFIVPPTHAEEMYSEEVFGRSGSDRVVVFE